MGKPGSSPAAVVLKLHQVAVVGCCRACVYVCLIICTCVNTRSWCCFGTAGETRDLFLLSESSFFKGLWEP